jgi:hypothetical protein
VHFDARQSVAVAVAINAPTPPLRDGISALLYRLTCGEQESVPRTPEVSAAAFRENELAGAFRGGDGSLQLSIESVSGGRLTLTIANPTTGFVLKRPLALDAQGHVADFSMSETTQEHPLSFFRDPADGTPALMLGWQAYRRA